ncbi:hypothetical protein NQ315_009354 [Exocentrus adspersus]|uniref:alpha-amylase n=1 Tax=Exocentrus adspersus TaxID=1586481 RepID=A0AAV8WHA2_9CUCU|nr:hypothetical protein NQ315_009354 [Exocentrus adspersus]
MTQYLTRTQFHLPARKMKTVLLTIVCSLAAVALAQKNNNFEPGRNTIVHLFEWKWSDIASECENFLGPKGYAGVQISPPNENEVINQDGGRPWWERYQPVSYDLNTRSGDESALADMISRCNAAGVKIYVDAVFNHMAAIGGTGTGGHDCDPGSKSYPAVPYGSGDFHTSCTVNNYNDAENVRNCELVGLPDLDQSKDYVREQIVGFLNHCVDLGVAGFRVDAAKHMYPADLEAIYGAVKDLPSGGRPFFYQEVIDLGGEAVSKDEYTDFGTVLEFKFGTELGNAFQGNNALKYLKTWGPEWGLLDGTDAVVFIDNHDNQRSGSSAILTYKNAKPYKMAIAFMLAHPYGTTRVMSSFAFDDNDQGPPSDEAGNIIGASINDDGTCGNGWVCEHRWRQIYNMVGFRNAVAGTDVTNWWDNDDNQIAFGRGEKGFIAFTLDGDINQSLPTSLPAGTYCDVISGGLEGGSCTGKSVTVDDGGNAAISLSSGEDDGVLAIHVNAKLLTAVLTQKNNNFVAGRNTIVHLFEWKWEDIAAECEHFLGPKGYAGVQISPPNENEIIIHDGSRPWWERYQPVSYELNTRSGDEAALADMISRCNAVGVRIYVDAVFNHMSAVGGKGTAGHDCDPDSKEYPAVPYGSNDFHKSCTISNYSDAENVRNCELGSLKDLDQSQDYVRDKIVEFLNHCVDLGVAGFRIDAAKHMWPEDLKAIYGAVKDLNTDHGFARGARPFFYQEVIDFGMLLCPIVNLTNPTMVLLQVVKPSAKKEYISFGTVLEFKYGAEVGNAFRGNNPLKYFKNWGPEWGLLDGTDAVAFVNNHDNERSDSDIILTYKQPKLYKMAVAFMLAHPYGTTNMISSYEFSDNDQGPPSDEAGNIIGASIKDDGTCGNGWVCEHRWRQIFNMVGFRNAVAGTGVTNWWDNDGNQIAFGRGNKGFIAFTLDGDIKQSLPTSLPAGIYCDVISGSLVDGSCSGKSVVVDDSGKAAISLSSSEDDGVVAIHVKAKI